VFSVIEVWLIVDWYECEVFDLMGVYFDGYLNLSWILMEDDWEGYSLCKDYLIGGEPVCFLGVE